MVKLANGVPETEQDRFNVSPWSRRLEENSSFGLGNSSEEHQMGREGDVYHLRPLLETLVAQLLSAESPLGPCKKSSSASHIHEGTVSREPGLLLNLRSLCRLFLHFL